MICREYKGRETGETIFLMYKKAPSEFWGFYKVLLLVYTVYQQITKAVYKLSPGKRDGEVDAQRCTIWEDTPISSSCNNLSDKKLRKNSFAFC